MFSFKNWVALGLFLFGTTFLWMTRDFLANPREEQAPSGRSSRSSF